MEPHAGPPTKRPKLVALRSGQPWHQHTLNQDVPQKLLQAPWTQFPAAQTSNLIIGPSSGVRANSQKLAGFPALHSSEAASLAPSHSHSHSHSHPHTQYSSASVTALPFDTYSVSDQPYYVPVQEQVQQPRSFGASPIHTCSSSSPAVGSTKFEPVRKDSDAMAQSQDHGKFLPVFVDRTAPSSHQPSNSGVIQGASNLSPKPAQQLSLDDEKQIMEDENFSYALELQDELDQEIQDPDFDPKQWLETTHQQSSAYSTVEREKLDEQFARFLQAQYFQEVQETESQPSVQPFTQPSLQPDSTVIYSDYNPPTIEIDLLAAKLDLSRFEQRQASLICQSCGSRLLQSIEADRKAFALLWTQKSAPLNKRQTCSTCFAEVCGGCGREGTLQSQPSDQYNESLAWCCNDSRLLVLQSLLRFLDATTASDNSKPLEHAKAMSQNGSSLANHSGLPNADRRRSRSCRISSKMPPQIKSSSGPAACSPEAYSNVSHSKHLADKGGSMKYKKTTGSAAAKQAGEAASMENGGSPAATGSASNQQSTQRSNYWSAPLPMQLMPSPIENSPALTGFPVPTAGFPQQQMNYNNPLPQYSVPAASSNTMFPPPIPQADPWVFQSIPFENQPVQVNGPCTGQYASPASFYQHQPTAPTASTTAAAISYQPQPQPQHQHQPSATVTPLPPHLFSWETGAPYSTSPAPINVLNPNFYYGPYFPMTSNPPPPTASSLPQAHPSSTASTSHFCYTSNFLPATTSTYPSGWGAPPSQPYQMTAPKQLPIPAVSLPNYTSSTPASTTGGLMGMFIDVDPETIDTSHLTPSKVSKSRKLPKGVGYGNETEDYKAFANRRSSQHPPQDSLLAQRERQNRDKLISTMIGLLWDVLPSLERISVFDLDPPPALLPLLLESCLLDEVADLLRNDSVADATRRNILYLDLICFVTHLAKHPMTLPIVIGTRLRVDGAGTNGAETVEARNSANTASEKPSVAAAMVNLVKQSRLILRSAHTNGGAFQNDDDGDMLGLCTTINDTAELLSLNFNTGSKHDEKERSENATNKNKWTEWHRAHCVVEVPDADIFETHYYASAAQSMKGGARGRMKRLVEEMANLTTSLPEGIFMRYAESRPDVMKVLIIGPEGTPYENGAFEFDVWCPANYPQDPPNFNFRTTGKGKGRFNPNLYEDGKVCLSLLNTWSGERWKPQESTLLQVFVSLQAMVFCEQPYYNEPGYERHGSSAEAERYNNRVQGLTVRLAMLDWLRGNQKTVWTSILNTHFARRGANIKNRVTAWTQSGALRYLPNSDVKRLSIALDQLSCMESIEEK